MRKVIAAIILRGNDYLLVRKNETYMFPGGKPEGTETDKECLDREFGQELSGTRITDVRPYKHFDGASPHKGDTVRVVYYFADVVGEVGKPSAEISDAVWANKGVQLKMSESTKMALEALVADGLIS